MVRIEATNGIPKLVLEGRIPKYKSVNTIFLSETLKQFYRLAYRSYIKRSRFSEEPSRNNKEWQNNPKYGEEDENGLKWRELKPRTRKIKKKLQGTGDYTEELQKANTRAAKEVLKILLDRDYSSGDGINIRTGRTLAACYPPYTIQGKLVAGPDQVIQADGIQVMIDFKTGEAAEEAIYGGEWGRPLFDGIEQEWMQKASVAGVIAARIEYDRLVAKFGPPGYVKNNDNRSRTSSGRKPPRRNRKR